MGTQNYKINYAILFVLFIILTSFFPKKSAYKSTVTGILVYDFEKQVKSNYYSEVSSSLLVDKINYTFYDTRNQNAQILHKHADFQKELGSDTIYSHSLFIPDSVSNINDSWYKKKSNNIDGVGTIRSHFFYLNEKFKNHIFIVLQIEAEVITYVNVKDYVKKLSPIIVSNQSKKKIMVLNKLIRLNSLTIEQVKKLNLTKSPISEITLFYSE